MKNRALALLVLAGVLSSGCSFFELSEDERAEASVVGADEKANLADICKSHDDHSTDVFILKSQAKDQDAARKRFCTSGTDLAAMIDSATQSLVDTAKEAKTLGVDTVIDIEVFADRVKKETDSTGAPPSVAHLGSTVDSDTLDYVVGSRLVRGSMIAEVSDMDECDTIISGLAGDVANCDQYIGDIGTIYNINQNMYEDSVVGPVATQLTALDKRWDDFLTATRGQTLLEVFVNSAIYRTKFGDYRSFTAPPASQLVLLHPSIAVDWTDGATDGDEISESLVLDVIGLSWWEKDVFGVSGIAGHVAHSDRAELKDWGYGFTFYIKNKWTLGFTKRDDEIGVFATLDLIKSVNDKVNIARQFRNFDFSDSPTENSD